MKEEEFNLSEKDHNMSMMPGDEEEHMYLQKDIKEFIKRLKEEFSNLKINPNKAYAKPYKIFDMCIATIDKLAGDDLS